MTHRGQKTQATKLSGGPINKVFAFLQSSLSETILSNLENR